MNSTSNFMLPMQSCSNLKRGQNERKRCFIHRLRRRPGAPTDEGPRLGSYLFEKPSFTLSSSTLWTYPAYTVIGWTVSPDLDTLRQSPRSTDGRFSATPGTCWENKQLCFVFCFIADQKKVRTDLL